MSKNMLNLNGQLFAEMPETLGLLQRAIYFGDGLFETIRVFNGRIPFLPLHWGRLSEGLKTLEFDTPDYWTEAFFHQEILRISPPNARIRLTVWRTSGGFYLPEHNTPQFLITADPLAGSDFAWPEKGLALCLCSSVRLPIDALSGLKMLNGARYVAAAREARAKRVDDAILLNAQERVCETSSSNLFWIKDKIVFVPPSFDGQINGTLANLLCELIREHGVELRQRPTYVADLHAADEVFLTNAIRGIRWVGNFEGTAYGFEQTMLFNYLLEKHLAEKIGVV